MRFEPQDFFAPATDRSAAKIDRQGMSHAEALAGLEAQVRKTMREKAKRALARMKAANPGRRFAQDAEEQIYQRLLAEHEENQAASTQAEEERRLRIQEIDASQRRQREEAKEKLAAAIAESDPMELARLLLEGRDRLLGLQRAGVLGPGDLPEIFAKIA